MTPSVFYSSTIATATLLVAITLSGCDHHHAEGSHDHDHSHGHEKSLANSIETTFREGTGLFFPEETKRALNLTTIEATEKPLVFSLPITAQVFQSGSPALASASVPTSVAAMLEGKRLSGAHLVRIDRSTTAQSGEAELILAIDTAAKPGDFISLTLALPEATTGVIIPRSALLRTTEGSFVYVANGDSFLRTPVACGKITTDEVEITDGLYSGDLVVSHPVEQLWLAELRFTKGGSHCH